MARSRTQRALVTTVSAEGGDFAARRHPDELIVEEPLTIQLDGVVVSTTMRTPGHDFELAVGYCHTEGLLAGAPVSGVRYCGTGSAVETELDPQQFNPQQFNPQQFNPQQFNPQQFNRVTVETGGAAPTPTPRLTATSSSCGWCGSDQLDELCARLAPLAPGAPVDTALLGRIPDLVRPHQTLFAATGAVHAAAAFTPGGDVLHVREDVGRHNAVDKVVGALLLAGRLPAARRDADPLGLFVSGRASVEMVQKAWAAGFTTLVAVSAPTALAVDAARRANLVLAGFVRADRYNVYSPERI